MITRKLRHASATKRDWRISVRLAIMACPICGLSPNARDKPCDSEAEIKEAKKALGIKANNKHIPAVNAKLT